MIIFEWNRVYFSIVDLGSGVLSEDIAPHSHSSNGYELHFITDGFGKLIIDSKDEYELKKGSFFVTGPNVTHAQTTNKSNPIRDIFIYIQKLDDNMANAVSSSFLDRRFFITNNFDFTDAENLLNEYYAKKMDYKTVVCAYAMKILTEIIRMYIPEEIAENIDGDNLYDKRFVIIENCLLYDKNITLTELADRVGVCPRQMQRLLKKYYGKSFREMKHKN